MAWNSDLDPQSPAYQIAADNSRCIRVLLEAGEHGDDLAVSFEPRRA
jgi:hypothetical protein